MEFLTVPEAAKLLRIGEHAAHKRARRAPAAVKVGNQWRIERGAFEELLAQGGNRLDDEGESS